MSHGAAEVELLAANRTENFLPAVRVGLVLLGGQFGGKLFFAKLAFVLFARMLLPLVRFQLRFSPEFQPADFAVKGILVVVSGWGGGVERRRGG